MTVGVLKGVMFNAYPDSIGGQLSDAIDLLQHPELEGAFSLFYILPTFFNSDLDRGFSIIDYDINTELVHREDIDKMATMGLGLKFDLVLNHLSVGSPQFRHLLEYGDDSPYKDFFIDWNEFWETCGDMGPEGYIIPHEECLDLLFMRKPEMPILKVRFPDGTDRPYWNTFYQEVNYRELGIEDLLHVEGMSADTVRSAVEHANRMIREGVPIADIDWGELAEHSHHIEKAIERKKQYLGQMDLNARSEKVWQFYEDVLVKLKSYGGKLVRLDAFAYLHKEPCKPNFFNKPGTWDHLDRLRALAEKHDLLLLPEIHAEFGQGLHEEVAGRGFPIYDFFLPGLVIDALDRGTSRHLLRWARELQEKNISTINMLGCHDGIPVLDLRGGVVTGPDGGGLLGDEDIDATVERILQRGGRVKNLFGPDGKKIAYYQINATFFSALGEDERKFLLARAIQLFMPGVPQIWYLDLFAGRNDYAAADNAGTAGHKEINRTTLSPQDIEHGLAQDIVRNQLRMIKLRNTSRAFHGTLEIGDTGEHELELTWKNGSGMARLHADLENLAFTVEHRDENGKDSVFAHN